MLSCYLTLGLEPGAEDEQIRAAFLAMVKKHTPEKDPERFQKINNAYEAIKDKRARVRAKLFEYGGSRDYEEALLDFAEARPLRRRRATLKELLEANEKIRRQKPRKGGA